MDQQTQFMKMNKTLKFVQINKGDSDFLSRTDQINDIIKNHKPNIVVINELNCKNDDNVARGQFPQFKLETDNLDIVDQMSRTGILIHKDVQYKRRVDLETQGTSTVWVQLSYPGRKSILLQAIYRQFQRIGVPGSKNPKKQRERWENIIKKWETAILEEKEIITMGDFNLNSLRWDLQETEKNSYDRLKEPMITMLKQRILEKGFKILSSEPTVTSEIRETGQSCLDLMITNRSDKISCYKAGLDCFSDHTLQTLTQTTRGISKSKKYLRMRIFKNFDQETFRDNIKNHGNYIEALYSRDPEEITEMLQKIIQESIEELAPVKIIQLKENHTEQVSEEVRMRIVERSIAQMKWKETKKPEDLRNYRNVRNDVNRMIAKEKKERKKKKFQGEGISLKDKWKLVKQETGQMNQTSPQIIIEGKTHFTNFGGMANSLNRQYIQRIRVLVNEMEMREQGTVPIDPLINFKKSIGPKKLSFTYKTVAMSQLDKTIRTMKATGSMGEDDVSTKIIKQALPELLPILLNLVNSVISTSTFPTQLKTTRIVPVEKSGKTTTSAEGWRPVNVVPAISKIIERVLLHQILDHLKENNLVPHGHHGALKGKSTQSLISEVHDILIENMANDEESALIILDQSKAYELVCHEILLKKLEVIGFKTKAVELMRNFLSERKQYVQIEGVKSDKLLIGPYSVIQGSTLSCALFLIYILDMPNIFHVSPHPPEEQRSCSEPNLKTFIDDSYIVIKKKKDEELKSLILKTMKKVEDYTLSNRLHLNQDKTQILLQTKNVEFKRKFSINLGGKEIKSKTNVNILGNTMSDDLTWSLHLTKNLIPALKNRVRTLRGVSKYLDKGFKAMFSNAIFKSKLMYGLESWGGAPRALISRIQKIHDQASKLAVPHYLRNKNSRQREEILGWLSVSNEISRATLVQTFKIINGGKPEELAATMPVNKKSPRLMEHKKLDNKPKWLNKNKSTRACYRNRAYEFNTLPKKVTSQENVKKFKKELKEYFKVRKSS